MEFTTIKISSETLRFLIDSDVLTNNDYEVIRVEIRDDLFDNDNTHRLLKDKSNKAYRELKNYEWNKRYGA